MTVVHEFSLREDAPQDAESSVTAELERTHAQLDALRRAAENWEDLEPRVISFEDPLFIAGSLSDVYEFLNAADKWPERVPHVTKLDLTEETPGLQFFDMHTHTPDAREHTTRSVRICLPENKIVYKQIGLPALLDAHTGHWVFVETPEESSRTHGTPPPSSPPHCPSWARVRLSPTPAHTCGGC